jgi:hypothetical protein
MSRGDEEAGGCDGTGAWICPGVEEVAEEDEVRSPSPMAAPTPQETRATAIPAAIAIERCEAGGGGGGGHG